MRHRLATASLAPHRSWTTEAVARIATRLGDLGRYDKALLVTSRALATIDAADATLTELAVVHDEGARALLVLNRGDLGHADLDSAVRLLARTVPERSPLCDGLSRAADELRATSTPLSTTVVERPGS